MALVFKEKYVAFLDILGFKALIDSPNFKIKVEGYFEKIEAALKKSTETTNHGIYPDDPIIYSVLSDSIILSISVPPGNVWTEKVKTLRFLLSAIEKIQYSLALDNIWLRGAISEGDLSHDLQNVIGKGFVKAYLLEQKAVYPRVLIDAGLFKKIFAEENAELVKSRKDILIQVNQTYGNADYSGKFIFDWQDVQVINKFCQDYPFFINYFNPLVKEDKNEERKTILNTLKILLYANEPSVYEKYRWVCDYLKAIVLTEINQRVELKQTSDSLTGEIEPEADFLKRKQTDYLGKYFDELSAI